MKVDKIEGWDLRYDENGRLHQTPDGAQIYYEQRGEGPIITVVSTMYVVSTAWRNFTGHLAERNRLITYDLRNQGASAESEFDAFAQHTDDLLGLLDALEIEQTYLLSSSVSTIICRDFTVAHPDRVKGLILVGPLISPWGSKRRIRITQSWLAALEAGGPRGLFDHIYPAVFGDLAIAQGRTPAYLAMRERFLAMNSHAQLRQNLEASLEASDDVSLLDAIDCPTLLMVGDDDYAVSRGAMIALRDRLGSGRVDVLENCGHLPYFEATDRFERSIQEFVTAVESGAVDSIQDDRLLVS